MIELKYFTRTCFSALIITIFTFWFFPIQAFAKEVFVCAPTCSASQTAKPDGSQKHPWPTVTVALDNVEANGGDTIFLLSGYYGHLQIKGHTFQTTVTIQPAPGANVHFETLNITDSENIRFRDLKVWPIGDRLKKHPLIRATKTTKSITFEDLELRGHKTAHNYMRWSKDSWLKYSINGIEARGENIMIRHNSFWGLGFSITTMGVGAQVINNTIKGFSGDGIRGLGDHSTFTDNRVQDCVKINKNHDDGFQSWSQPPGKGVITGLTLKRNMFIEWSGSKAHPLRCTLQGIGLFDGTYKDLTIENNLIAVSAYHGISVYGGDNISITHNTVVNIFGDSTSFPWIMVSPHKNGTPSHQVAIGNNLAMGYKLLPPPKTLLNPILNANMLIRHPFRVFANPKKLNFNLKSSSSAQGAGRTDFATRFDISGVKRPENQQPDVGAYQSD